MFIKYAFQYIIWNNLKESTFQDCLSPDERRLRDRRYPRCSVPRWEDSPFKYLLDSQNDQALVNATGLPLASFNELLIHFSFYYHGYTFSRRTGQIRKLKNDSSRKRKFPAEGALGLVLVWY